MGHLATRMGSVMLLILMIIGSAFAGNFDYNPGIEAVKHKK